MKEGNNGNNSTEYFYHKNNDVIGNINKNALEPFTQFLYFQSIQKSLPNRLKNSQTFSFAVLERIPILKSILSGIEQFHHFLFTKFILPSYPTNLLIYFAIFLLFFSYLIQIAYSEQNLQKSPPLYIYWLHFFIILIFWTLIKIIRKQKERKKEISIKTEILLLFLEFTEIFYFLFFIFNQFLIGVRFAFYILFFFFFTFNLNKFRNFLLQFYFNSINNNNNNNNNNNLNNNNNNFNNNFNNNTNNNLTNSNNNLISFLYNGNDENFQFFEKIHFFDLSTFLFYFSIITLLNALFYPLWQIVIMNVGFIPGFQLNHFISLIFFIFNLLDDYQLIFILYYFYQLQKQSIFFNNNNNFNINIDEGLIDNKNNKLNQKNNNNNKIISKFLIFNFEFIIINFINYKWILFFSQYSQNYRYIITAIILINIYLSSTLIINSIYLNNINLIAKNYFILFIAFYIYLNSSENIYLYLEVLNIDFLFPFRLICDFFALFICFIIIILSIVLLFNLQKQTKILDAQRNIILNIKSNYIINNIGTSSNPLLLV